jgi:hypothetical protein
VKTNDIKKGALVELRNGWQARIEDNRKGNIRMATVYGFETEMGSIYAHDIAVALVPYDIDPDTGDLTLNRETQHGVRNYVRVAVNLTPAQLKLKKTLETLY